MRCATETLPEVAHAKAKSRRASVRLVPWDPESPTHVQRMVEQRLSCGWKAEMVHEWIELQRTGKIAMQWVVIASTDPDESIKLMTHIEAHPKEATTLQDTSGSLAGKILIPTNEAFLPIGHISLNTEYESPGHDDGTEGLYWVSSFYISASLQGAGLGRAAMDAVERTATEEPLNAKVLALSCVARETMDEKEQWLALGRQPPNVTNQDWYGRRGYVPYKRVDDFWNEVDKEGRVWPFNAVFMRKVIA